MKWPIFTQLMLLCCGLGTAHVCLASNIPVTDTVPRKVTLREGTEITFELFQNLNSKDLGKGKIVEMSVYKDVTVDGKTVINSGRWAEGRIVEVKRAGLFGRPGKIVVEVISVEAVDRQTLPVNSQRLEQLGQDKRTIAWTTSIVAPVLGFVAIPSPYKPAAIPLFLFGLLFKGKEAEISAGEKIRATVQRDVIIKT